MNIEQNEHNKVYVQGIIENEPMFSHSVKNEELFTFNLRVARLSGQNDIIPITISKTLISQLSPKQGDKFACKGQFRSFNKIVDEKSKLFLTVFAKEICNWNDTANPNNIELEGYICKPVIYRTTPFAREISDVLVAVNRNFNKSDYIPCIVWGNNARLINTFSVGTPIKIEGRIQSREYKKDLGLEIVTRTAYEVSVSKLFDASQDLT